MSRAYWALGVLLLINLVNYMDRYVVSSLVGLIQADLGATDAQMGALASAFMVVYMCAAPPIGYLADRIPRKAWIAAGVALWSVATLLSGAARGYAQLFAARAAVGIGESCYGSVSPSFVAEHFPPERRAGVMAIFSMAIPVGSALGFLLGGLIGHHWGWRQAFWVAGVPGLVLAFLALGLRDPRTEAPREGAPAAGPASAPTVREYLDLRRNRSLVSCTLAMTAMTFGLGAMAFWMPVFFIRTWGLNAAEAGKIFGAVTVAAGLGGSLAGGWLADRVLRVTSKSYFLVSGVGLILALPCGMAAILAPSLKASVACLLAAELFAFLNMGPLNALIVSVTEGRVRSMAFAANIFVIHALGDAVSPYIVGWISDRSGLRSGLLAASLALGAAGAIALWGMRYVDEDTARVKDHG